MSLNSVSGKPPLQASKAHSQCRSETESLFHQKIGKTAHRGARRPTRLTPHHTAPHTALENGWRLRRRTLTLQTRQCAHPTPPHPTTPRHATQPRTAASTRQQTHSSNTSVKVQYDMTCMCCDRSPTSRKMNGAAAGVSCWLHPRQHPTLYSVR